MGDIAFLLIIFFMLVGQIHKDMNIEMAESENIESLERVPFGVSVDKEGIIRLQGIECSTGELSGALVALVGTEKNQTVELTVDKEVLPIDYRPVIAAIAESGAKIQFIGTRKRSN